LLTVFHHNAAGSHTAKDIEYAEKAGKRVMVLQDLEKLVGSASSG
jgi:SpoU rRNA methylase family enzyme